MVNTTYIRFYEELKGKVCGRTRRVKTKEDLLLTPLPPSFYKFHLWALFCLSSIIRHFTKSQGACTWPLSTAKHCDKGYSSGSTAFIQLIASSSLWENGSHDRNTLESHFSRDLIKFGWHKVFIFLLQTSVIMIDLKSLWLEYKPRDVRNSPRQTWTQRALSPWV